MLIRPLAEELAQRRDRLREVVFLDDRIAPHRIHELALGDQPAGVADRCSSVSKARLVIGNGALTAVREQPPAGVEPEVAEGVKGLVGHCRLLAGYFSRFFTGHLGIFQAPAGQRRLRQRRAGYGRRR